MTCQPVRHSAVEGTFRKSSQKATAKQDSPLQASIRNIQNRTRATAILIYHRTRLNEMSEKRLASLAARKFRNSNQFSTISHVFFKFFKKIIGQKWPEEGQKYSENRVVPKIEEIEDL